MIELKCEKCSHLLATLPGSGHGLLISRFPEHILNAFVHLASGPSVLPCQRCGYSTQFDTSQLVLGQDGAAVLYVPDDRIGPDRQRDKRLLKMIEKFRASAEAGALEITRDRRSFRRAFLNAFILSAINLANQFSLHSGPETEWVTQHEKNLGEAFFAAQWLMSEGVIPTFQAKAGEQLQETVLPHEQAPQAANNVVKRREIERLTAKRAGTILGSLMLIWAMRTFEARSLEPWREALPHVIRSPALSNLTLEEGAERIGSCVKQIKLGTPGAIVFHYIFEAILATLCDANGVPNPRKENWTRILLLYEYHRRVDGNDEALLLPAEIVCRTIDLAEFWSGVRAIQRSIGSLDLQAAAQHEKVMDRHEHVVETVRRLFPDYTSDVSRAEIRIREAVPDAQIAAALSKPLRVAVDAFPDRTALRMILSGLTRGRRHLLEGAVGDLRSVLDDVGANAEQRMVALHCAIEVLNLAHLYAAASKLAEEARQLIEMTPSADPKIRAELYNEIGNCYRYAGRHEAALKVYDDAIALWGNDISNRNTRVLLRNRAIVLRGLHRYGEASQGFAELRPFAQNLDLLALLNSEAICLFEMGEQDQAAKLLDDHAELIEGAPTSHSEARALGLLRAKLLLSRGQMAEARTIASHLASLAEEAQDAINQASAADILVSAIGEDLPEAEQAKQRQNAIRVLQSALGAAREMVGMPELLSGIGVMLDDVLLADGRAAEGEALIRGILADAVPGRSTKAWALAMHAYSHAVRRRDFRQAREDLVLGVDLLGSEIWSVSAQSDPIALLAPNAEAVTYLTEHMLEHMTARSPVGAASLRIAADLRAAPLLTPRLRRRAGLPSPVTEKLGEAERLLQLMRETPCIIIQFVSLHNDVGLLVTRPETEAADRPELRHLELHPDAAARVARLIEFAMSRADPEAVELDLDSVDGWIQLRSRLRALVADCPTEWPLCLVSGPLSSTILSLALGDERALCFVPSVGALLGLRALRRTLPGGLAWRPHRLFAFAAWFETESVQEAAALRSVSEHLSELAQAHAAQYAGVVGPDASASRLLDGLKAADLAYIACHGRILPEAEAVDLIVAADGRLPPGDLSGLLEDYRTPHVLGWRQLAELPSAPPVILSSACNSGLTVLHRGGERLGLARPLLSAGTLTFIAPQWPVPTVKIQQCALAVLRRWLSDSETSLVTAVAQQRAEAARSRTPPLAAKALAVFGDGL